MKAKLTIPKRLAVVLLVAGCSDPSTPQKNQALCPTEYQCSSDAARAFNCTDMSPNPFESDFGTCFPPV